MPISSFTDVANCAGIWTADGTLWQDSARTIAATADGDPVASWDDASGNSNHAKQTTAGKRPLLKTNILNGHPAIRFDGADDLLTLTTNLTQTAHTVCAVVKMISGIGDDAYHGLLVASTFGVFLQLSAESSKWGEFANVNIPGDTALSNGTFYQLSAVARGANDIDLITERSLFNNTSGASWQARSATAIGADAGGSQWSNIDLVALVFYSRALTSTELTDVEDLLGELYGRSARAYYFASSGDDNTGDGTIGSPYQTSSKAASLGMRSGDSFYFNGGDTFNPLQIKASTLTVTPTSTNPAIVTSYGTGKAVFNAGNGYGVWSDALAYSEIRNIDVQGSGVTFVAGSPNTTTSTSTEPGIKAINTGSSNLGGLIIDSCTVSGCKYGIIIGDVTQSVTAGYDDYEITNNSVSEIQNIGIQSSNYNNFTPLHQNGLIDRNVVSNVYGDGSTNSGYPISCLAQITPVVSRNICMDSGSASGPAAGAGPVGILISGVSDATVSNNVVLNQSSQSGNDGQGIDVEDAGGTSNVIIERNYISGCREGISVLKNVSGSIADIAIRFNEIQQCTSSSLRFFGVVTGGYNVFNNTVFHNVATNFISQGAGTAPAYYNNLVAIRNGATASYGAATNSGNYTDPTDGDAGLRDIGNGPTSWPDTNLGATSVTAYDPATKDSAVVGAGLDLNAQFSIDIGTTDFHGRGNHPASGFVIGAATFPLAGGIASVLCALDIL